MSLVLLVSIHQFSGFVSGGSLAAHTSWQLHCNDRSFVRSDTDGADAWLIMDQVGQLLQLDTSPRAGSTRNRYGVNVMDPSSKKEFPVCQSCYRKWLRPKSGGVRRCNQSHTLINTGTTRATGPSCWGSSHNPHSETFLCFISFITFLHLQPFD